MIERCTIKFGPAVSQKELEKVLYEAKRPEERAKLRKMKARVVLIDDIEGANKLSDRLKELSSATGER